ncbi:MAG TPA: alkaline phosphatase family protein [Acidimicrobiales bacterium]|nr:alkaline phosphatase family protein [Acidimicrobiales bacterium]
MTDSFMCQGAISPGVDLDDQNIRKVKPSGISRRKFLAGSVGAASAAFLAACGGTELVKHAASICPAGTSMDSIDHVVLLMLENRSFDACFGTYPGVRGFNDHPAGNPGVFSQVWPGAPANQQPPGRLLPYHLDAATVAAQCSGSSDIPAHDWGTQHESWDNGKMDAFVRTHMAVDIPQDLVGNPTGAPSQGGIVMGYMDRNDLPFMWALADNFTLCDNAFCSVLGPTMPNRLMWLSGTMDPEGRAGGPVLVTPSTSEAPGAVGSATWTSMPEVLSKAGVDWKVYQPPGSSVGALEKLNLAIGFNALLYFKNLVGDPTSDLYKRAFLPSWPDDFASDVKNGTLPQVSWMVPNIVDSMHPSGTPANAEWYISQVLSTLVSNPQVWSKTALFIMFDENGGYFDHVAPPVAPPGTAGEYLTGTLSPDAAGVSGPVGLGFRVPLLVVSPFSRGGYINSDPFDHTSALRFLESRFGVRIDNISAWRRKTVGDLTSTLDPKKGDTSVPTLPSTEHGSPLLSAVCPDNLNPVSLLGNAPPLNIPASLSMPTQLPGAARRRTSC